MRILILEVSEGHAKLNLESLINANFTNGLSIDVLNLEKYLSDKSVLYEDTDYFEYLQSVPDHVPSDTIDSVAKIILEEVPINFLLVPIAYDSKSAILGYITSWILSYAYCPGLKGAVYYADKNRIKSDSKCNKLYKSFKNLFEFEIVETDKGDLLFLDMPDRYKHFFYKFKKKEED